jgi:hypothetical protein
MTTPVFDLGLMDYPMRTKPETGVVMAYCPPRGICPQAMTTPVFDLGLMDYPMRETAPHDEAFVPRRLHIRDNT